jgi:hypothetical protein
VFFLKLSCQQLNGEARVAGAEVKVFAPFFDHGAEIPGDGDAGWPASFAFGCALAAVGADVVFVGFLPEGEKAVRGRWSRW